MLSRIKFLKFRKNCFVEKYTFLVRIEALAALQEILEIFEDWIFREYACLLRMKTVAVSNLTLKIPQLQSYRKIRVCRPYRETCSLVWNFGNFRSWVLERKRVSTVGIKAIAVSYSIFEI